MRPPARILLALALGLSACAPLRRAPADPPPAAGVARTLIYLVDGEASYTWHDSEGRRRLADTEAVAQALEVARRSPRAEVFIFHQTHRRYRLWGPDGVLYQYRNGAMVRKEDYFQAQGRDYAAEAALFAKYAAAPFPRACPEHPDYSRPETFLLYFGHEIPAIALVGALARFAPPCPAARPFSLVALSSCHGGTPAMTQALAPYSEWLLASPGNLHLSFLDARAFSQLWEAGPKALGESIAQESFDRLRKTVHTEITLALYDTEKASAWLEERRGAWDFMGKAYRDCGDDPAFGPGGNPAGASVWYQAPRFGPGKGKSGHSGWECPDPGLNLIGVISPK